MMRLKSAFLEMAFAAIPLVPVMLVLWRRRFHDVRKTAVYTLFALYLAAVYSLVGLPSVNYVRFHLNLNVIPFLGIIADLKNSLLNVLLFIPLGLFLSCLWVKFRSVKAVALHGFLVALAIEALQIFTFRATDVNDLITNTTGAVLGWCLARIAMKRFPRLCCACESKDLTVLYGTVLAVMFFVHPYLSNFFWGLIPW